MTKLPKIDRGPMYNFDEDVALKYYRIEKTSEGAIELEKGKKGELSGPLFVGTGIKKGEKIELSRLIDLLNERFGTEFKVGDQLFFDSIKEDALADSKLEQAALANTKENFGYVFRKALEDLFIYRTDQNDEIVAKFMDEKEFREIVSKYLLEQVYNQFRARAQKRESK